MENDYILPTPEIAYHCVSFPCLIFNYRTKFEFLANAPASMYTVGSGSSVIQTNDGTRIVQSGRTSDGKPYVRESTDKIVGDTLRHVERIYDPTTNSTKVHGYTLDLKDPNAKPVPINEVS